MKLFPHDSEKTQELLWCHRELEEREAGNEDF